MAVSLDTATALGAPIELGLCPAAAVAFVPGTVKGIYTQDAGGYIPDTCARGLFESSYDRIRQERGANLLAVSDVVWVSDFDVPNARVTTVRTMCATCRAGMFARPQYTRLVAAARSRARHLKCQ